LELGNYVHLVYAMSKDFGLSGLRVGACYSENLDIRLALQKLNDLCQISSQTQNLVETMLNDKDGSSGEYWTDTFLKENHARIRERCDTWQACLDECGIPYLSADSGLFVWMDMTQFLPPLDPASIMEDGEEEPLQMDDRERTLYLELVKEYGLLFTPGRSMRTERPGFFRCVFTAASDEEFELSLTRLRTFVTAKQDQQGA
jgi:aspartate/methionine/tyrosine aminotransferase